MQVAVNRGFGAITGKPADVQLCIFESEMAGAACLFARSMAGVQPACDLCLQSRTAGCPCACIADKSFS